MKSILDIDVRDEKWKQFIASVKEYQDNTQKLNEVWKHFDVATNKPRAATEALDKAIGRARKSSEAMGKTWAQVTKHIGESDKKLSHFERTIHGVERGLSRVARFGLKIGKFALAAGGIGGLGGLFGLDLLANAAMNRQKSARGLGVSIGQSSAFSTYMQPFLENPKGFLQAVVNARQNPTQEWAFPALGIPLGQAERENPIALAHQVMERVRSLYLENRSSPALSAILKAHGGDVFGMGLSSARLLANAPQSQLQAAYARESVAARQMQLSDRTATQWTNLKVQLHEAGIAIETTLTKKLVPLAPLIGELSKKVVHFINEFVNSKDVTKFIHSVGSGLKEAFQFIESKKFQTDLTELGHAANVTAKALLGVASAVDHHKKLAEYGIGGAAGLWLTRNLAKAWKVLRKPLGGAAGDAEDAVPAVGAGVASFAALVGGLLYPHSLANGDMPLPSQLYRNPKYLRRHGLIVQSGFYTNPKDWRKYNDPGNIDPIVNGVHEYRAYPSMGAGYWAIAKRVLGYHVPSTVQSLVSTFEGHNAKNLQGHIAQIAHWMHVGRNQRLNLKNPNQLSELVTGLAEFENPHRRDYRQLYNTIRDAIVEGMQSVKITTHATAASRVATSLHAARY